MYQRRTSDRDICAENVRAGSIRKLTRSDPNQVRIPTLQGLRGFRKTSQAQEASRVEPRFLRPMHYDSSAWDFLICTNEKQAAAKQTFVFQVHVNEQMILQGRIVSAAARICEFAEEKTEAASR